jgi:hypothetical protein
MDKLEKIETSAGPVNPTQDKGNYLIQIVSDGQIIKEILAINSTIQVQALGESSAAAVIK